jgi:CO dehydrogenase maturation factor
MSRLIAVTGKGGTGKTTVSAALVRLLLEAGVRPVLAVDADPNHNLAPILGVSVGRTLSDIREEIMESKSRASSTPKERLLKQRLEECLVEAEGFDLLAMGRPEGPSCYCYVNNLLREALRLLAANYRAAVIDNEAGMEHLSRMNLSSVDCLLVVSEPGAVSARAAGRIAGLAESLGLQVGRRVLVWNKVAAGGLPPAALRAAAGRTFDAELELPADREVEELAVQERSIFGARLPEAFAGLAEVCGAGLGKAASGKRGPA